MNFRVLRQWLWYACTDNDIENSRAPTMTPGDANTDAVNDDGASIMPLLKTMAKQCKLFQKQCKRTGYSTALAMAEDGLTDESDLDAAMQGTVQAAQVSLGVRSRHGYTLCQKIHLAQCESPRLSKLLHPHCECFLTAYNSCLIERRILCEFTFVYMCLIVVCHLSQVVSDLQLLPQVFHECITALPAHVRGMMGNISAHASSNGASTATAIPNASAAAVTTTGEATSAVSRCVWSPCRSEFLWCGVCCMWCTLVYHLLFG